MKVIKRMGAMIIAIVMVLAMGITAFAAHSGYTDVYIHKYVNPGGTLVAGDGTVKDTTGLAPVNGIEFKVYAATLKTGVTNTNSTDPDDYDVDKTTAIYTGVTGAAGVDGQIIFEDVPDGLYYVEETLSATSTDTTGFFLKLPMTNPVTGTDYLDEVHVYPKNTMTSGDITKEVLDNGTAGTSTSADVGDNVTWQINATIPGEFANADTAVGSDDYFKITDTLDKSLTFISATVKIGDTTLTADTDTTTNDYKLTTTTNSDGKTTVTIEFTEAQLQKLVDALKTTSATITVDLTTTINENAYDGMLGSTSGDYKIYNQASYEWEVGDGTGGGDTPDPENPDPEDPDPPYVTVKGLLIYKTDENEDPLAGAIFKVANSNDNSASNTSYIESTGTYDRTTNANGYAYWSSDDLNDIFSNDEGLFYAYETVAPNGYAKIVGYKAFSAALSTATLSATLELQNLPSGFDLPVTGGAGTLLFTIGGIILIAVACVFIVIQKKKKSAK